MLGPVSTNSGATAPGNITMSDRPRMGNVSGNERDEMREGSSGFPVVPMMLINSVSDGVIFALVNAYCLESSPGKRFTQIYCPSAMGSLVLFG